jgi:hypothetical protein
MIPERAFNPAVPALISYAGGRSPLDNLCTDGTSARAMARRVPFVTSAPSGNSPR